MLTHAQIWGALDRLAARSGLSASGLAKKAGLDPTTFNKSKRITPDGRPRWPSTESVAKSLAATGCTIEAFVQLIDEKARPPAKAVPLISFGEAGGSGFFDDAGLPAGKGWDELPFPALNDEHAYALEVAGNAMEPAYRDGTILLVSPGASIRRNDRVVVKTRDGGITVQELKRRTAKTVELRSVIAAQSDRSLPARDVAWMARVMWASQ
jgi:phage repressor protein C with HTH and peptisase S24 domain